MSNLAPKQTIPTVAQAVERFLATRQRGSWRELASVLSGPPSGRVVGRQAAGPTLARSELGALRCDRVTADQFVAWLHQRHPDTLAPATFKRGRSALAQFLRFAAGNGWVEERVLMALPSAPPSPPRRDWLRPEQVVALDKLVTERDFSAHQVMMWRVALNTGVRVEELVGLRPRDLNQSDAVLVVIGKGKKRRRIPVGEEFRKEWSRYVIRHELAPNGWLFPLTGVRFTAGGGHSERVVLDSSRHADAKAVRSMLSALQDLARDEVRAGRFDPDLLPSFSLTPHTLRRTYATSNLIASALLGAGHGLDLRSLQDAMGHESLETTALYLSDVADYINRHRRPISVVEASQQVVALAQASRARELAVA